MELFKVNTFDFDQGMENARRAEKLVSLIRTPEQAQEVMSRATEAYLQAVSAVEVIDVPEDERLPVLTFKEISDTAEKEESSTIYIFSSTDPYQEANPEAVKIAKQLIKTTTSTANKLYEIGNARFIDGDMAYLPDEETNERHTIVSRALMNAHPDLRRWVANLPAAEQLGPVAKPGFGPQDGTLMFIDGQIVHIPNSKELSVLLIGANDGYGVRERAELEKSIIEAHIDSSSNNPTNIISLGTGTGGPAINVALASANGRAVRVTGVDYMQQSLEVAKAVADHISQGLPDNQDFSFSAKKANILNLKGKYLRELLADPGINFVEMMGFAEYVPSDSATDPAEVKLRAKMKAQGCVSAEEYYGIIYECMPKGATLVTGNMRKDSKEVAFVDEGLRWQGIIKRTTEEVESIFNAAGIPPSARTRFEPGPNSSGVYNLWSIIK